MSVKAFNPSSNKRQQGKISASFLWHFALMAFATLVLVLLQYQYWNGEFGHQNLKDLKQQVAQQENLNLAQQKTNAVLRADIDDLKTGLGAIEEHARMDLGFIKQGETFVQMSIASDNVVQEDMGTDSAPASEPIDDDTFVSDDVKTGDGTQQ